jgi:hypothetical protein
MSNLLKTFGRDGDSYGRHALVNPGDSGDVIGKLPASALEYVDPMRFDPDYVGRHRAFNGYADLYQRETHMHRWAGYGWWLQRADGTTTAPVSVR